MGKHTDIDWADHTFNPWVGCTKVSPGCEHCYAEARMDRRLHYVAWGGEPRRTSEGNWQQPRKWDREAQQLVY
jgi:protein gp37